MAPCMDQGPGMYKSMHSFCHGRETCTKVQVSQGDSVITALGSGILVPVSEVAIMFHSGAPPSPGHLAASLGK
jgi:hypothetical protein